VQIIPITLGLAQAYLIVSPTGMALVDAGSPGHERAVLHQMQLLRQTDLRLIFITHAHLDHYGSAAALRRITGAPIAIHRLDGEALALGRTDLGEVRGYVRWLLWLFPLVQRLFRPQPVEADLLVQDGQDLSDFGIPAQVLHTPGHTPGSSCLLLDGGHAFAGDLLSTTGRPHTQRYYATDWAQLPASLARLKACRPEWVYAGHGRKPLLGRVLQEMDDDTIG
jgi:hydroxyacylglutathione hydrolase